MILQTFSRENNAKIIYNNIFCLVDSGARIEVSGFRDNPAKKKYESMADYR